MAKRLGNEARTAQTRGGDTRGIQALPRKATRRENGEDSKNRGEKSRDKKVSRGGWEKKTEKGRATKTVNKNGVGILMSDMKTRGYLERESMESNRLHQDTQ